VLVEFLYFYNLDTTGKGGTVQKFWGIKLTNQNSVQEEVKIRLKSERVSHHSVQNLLSSSLLYKNIKIHRTIILRFVFLGCEIWSPTLKEERRLKVLGNRVLRRMFGPKRDEVTGKWRKLHNEESTDTYSSPNIIRVMKSQRMSWAKQVARVGEKTGFWWGNPRERDHLEDPRVDGRITLRWIFKKWDVGIWTGLICLRSQVAGSCTRGNEPSGSVKCGEFLD
jgi:hypothetical protein